MEMEGRFMQGWLNLGELAYNLERYDLAAEAILKGYNLNSDRPPHLLFHAAAAYVMAERPESAVPILEELVSGAHGTPKIEWFRALVSAALQLDDKSLGGRAVESMLKEYPDDQDAWLLASQYHSATGEFRKAAVALTITGYLRPLSREEQIQLGSIFSAINIPHQSSIWFKSALGDSASPAEYEMLASAYLAAHEKKEALHTLERAIEEEPTPRLWSLLGDLYYMERSYRDSMEAFGKCAELDKNHSRAYVMMGYCALELWDIDQAIAHFETASGFEDQRDSALQLIARLNLMRQ
jgi:tetratricopeptide (TPR) repeat protein